MFCYLALIKEPCCGEVRRIAEPRRATRGIKEAAIFSRFRPGPYFLISHRRIRPLSVDWRISKIFIKPNGFRFEVGKEVLPGNHWESNLLSKADSEEEASPEQTKGILLLPIIKAMGMIFSLEGTIARPNFTSTKLKISPVFSFQGEGKKSE